MRRTSRFTILDVMVCAAVIILAATTLAPAVARMSRSPEDAKCQSNMQRWAEAMELYLGDFGRYPTNRPLRGSTVMSVNWAIVLSPDEIDPATGEPRRFVYGITWVEALYPYLWDRAERTGQDWKSFMRCPASSTTAFPTGASYTGCRMHYAFSSCLVEQPPSTVRRPRNLMMIRETGDLTVSTLRPTASLGYPARPQYPFLTRVDISAHSTDSVCRPHSGGSHMMFADGHVKHFTLDYYPENTEITSSKCWDNATQQWYNFFYANPQTPDQIAKNKSIAITP